MAEGTEGRIALTIGTAGHVDHGKTTLVRRMTGTDTDRLEEEHRRGISIVPGYAELVLPGGRRASLVDVPGHERFVKNMVSGATGVDAFLLVVAADDGVMPQTREHLDVLRVLGVERGVVALTKTDAVDEETVEFAALDAEELLESVGISAPVVPVSGRTGEGIGDLLQALDGLAAETSGGGGDAGGLARLPVDRAFVLRGIGVVVTGTLWSGEIRPGDALFTPSGHRPRVRSIQNHGRPAGVAHPGARTALDLVGVEISQVEAGDVLTSRPVPQSLTFDARLRLLEGARPLAHGVRVRLHHGTRATNARVRLSNAEELAPGESAFARIRPEEPVGVLPGDRFVVRSLAPQVTIGGGTVLDPAPSGRRPDPGWLAALEGGDPARTIPLLVARRPGEGLTAAEISLAVSAPAREVLEAADQLPEVTRVGDDLYAPAETIREGRDRLFAALRLRADERPESPEISVAEARSAMNLGARLADALLDEMAGAEVRVTGTGVSLPDSGGVPAELRGEAQALLEKLEASGAEPPTTEVSPALRLLLKEGEVVDLGAGLFASRETADRILEDIKTVCREEGEISLPGLRDRLGTSRRYAQAWLEFSDASGVTSRTGDVRVLTRRHRRAM